ncbi:hypothetical protein F4553_001911 [Allocatelliglobosispora scoriae]|uniref:Uncharacterized protein n=1 Tax=Allocatelliglobosispora scoriae TaxID=643052 RepID=A0A841BP64_9ACTN|nr:hypothetical protein [Allocatelliglobosispora scoriae]
MTASVFLSVGMGLYQFGSVVTGYLCRSWLDHEL